MRIILIASSALALASCVAGTGSYNAERQARATAELDRLLAGYSAGEPRSCVESRDLRGPEAYGETTLIFREGRRTIWRTETSGGCDKAGRDALITRQFGTSRMCRGDIARTADLTAGFPTGSCSFGDFVPYRKGG